MNETDKAMLQAGTGVELAVIKPHWQARVQSVFDEANINMPAGTWMQHGGKDGRHSEHLGYILTELQFVQRAYPNMQW